MQNILSDLINELKQVEGINSQPSFVSFLSSIDKLNETNEMKAYMLGQFFKFKFDSDNLDPERKKHLIKIIKENKLEDYFYLKHKPKDHGLSFLAGLCLLIGFVSLIVGVLKLINGDFRYGLATKYLVPIIREGGYFVIFGLVLIIGGFIRVRYERKGSRLCDALQSQASFPIR